MSKMYAFHGADNKTGTTMITQSVAEFIADNLKDIKIMMISLHGRSEPSMWTGWANLSKA